MATRNTKGQITAHTAVLQQKSLPKDTLAQFEPSKGSARDSLR